MKRKLISVILVVALSLSLLCGCGTLFVLNAEVDYNQILATINYNGMIEYVKKGEVTALMNSTGYTYVSQYGYSVEDTVDLMVESLAKRKLLILKAEEYYVEEYNKTHDDKIDKTALSNDIIYNKLITPAELKKAIEGANETLQTAYDEIYEELEKDEILNSGGSVSNDDDSTSETEDEVEFRPVPPEDEEDFDPNAPVQNMPKYFTDSSNWENKTKLQERAYNKLMSNLKSNYLSYDYYLKSEVEQILLDNYKDYISATGELDDIVNVEYQELILKNKITFTSKSDYETALTNEENIAYHPIYRNEGGNILMYGYVKNILLKFDDELTAELENFESTGVNNSAALTLFRKSLADKISVPVSNLNYNAESSEKHNCLSAHTHTGSKASCKYHVCADSECELSPYVWKITVGDLTYYPDDLEGKTEEEIIESINNGTFESDMKFSAEKIMALISKDLSLVSSVDETIEVMEKWIYLVSDDTGMFADDDTLNNYLIVPEGSTSSYVEEFTDLGRALVNQGKGTYTLDQTVVDGLKGSYIYSAAATGKTIAYCVTEYGIHIMIVTALATDYGSVPEGQDYYEDSSVKEKIKEKITTDYETQYYYDFQNDFLSGQAIESMITYNESVKNQVIKESKKTFGIK